MRRLSLLAAAMLGALAAATSVAANVPDVQGDNGAIVKSYSGNQVAGSIWGNREPGDGGAFYTELQLNMWQVVAKSGPVIPQYDAILSLTRWWKGDDGSGWTLGSAFCVPDPPNGTAMPPGSMTFGSTASEIGGIFTCGGNLGWPQVFTIAVDLTVWATGDSAASTDAMSLGPGNGVMVIKTTQTPAGMTGTAIYEGVNWARGAADVMRLDTDVLEVRTPRGD